MSTSSLFMSSTKMAGSRSGCLVFFIWYRTRLPSQSLSWHILINLCLLGRRCHIQCHRPLGEASRVLALAGTSFSSSSSSSSLEDLPLMKVAAISEVL